ncbi:MAG: hypothetical protein Q4G69_13350 [Planctomycetia bacterium]|nr:hypothetical protein [Planctomycetia bacterium]
MNIDLDLPISTLDNDFWNIPNLQLIPEKKLLVFEEQDFQFFGDQNYNHWSMVFDRIINIQGWDHLVFDFQENMVFDISILSMLLWYQEQLLPYGYQISLCGLNEESLFLFNRTCLDQFFTIYEDLEEVLVS